MKHTYIVVVHDGVIFYIAVDEEGQDKQFTSRRAAKNFAEEILGADQWHICKF